MRNFLLNSGMLLSLIAAIIASHWFNIEFIGNLAIAIMWVLIALAFVALAVASDYTDKRPRWRKKIGMWLNTSLILTMFAAGWFFIGFAYLIAYAILEITIYKIE